MSNLSNLEAISFARFITFNGHKSKLKEAQIQSKQKGNCSKFNGQIEAFSLENELQAWNLLVNVAKKALSKYPTTIN